MCVCLQFPCIYINDVDGTFLGVGGGHILENGVKSEIVKSDSININSIDKKNKFIGLIITNDNIKLPIVILFRSLYRIKIFNVSMFKK